jgi:hypothetical protein
MLQRILVFGLLGPLALISGCATGLTGGSQSADAPSARATPRTESGAADRAAQTKEVTLSVSGMT